MYVTSKISISNFKLIDNLIVSPDTSTVCGELRLMTGVLNEVSEMEQRLIACVQSAND